MSTLQSRLRNAISDKLPDISPDLLIIETAAKKQYVSTVSQIESTINSATYKTPEDITLLPVNGVKSARSSRRQAVKRKEPAGMSLEPEEVSSSSPLKKQKVGKIAQARLSTPVLKAQQLLCSLKNKIHLPQMNLFQRLCH
ncbi:hypothetical protein V565_173160, partial [Rhizoctonia solani 123E]